MHVGINHKDGYELKSIDISCAIFLCPVLLVSYVYRILHVLYHEVCCCCKEGRSIPKIVCVVNSYILIMLIDIASL